MNEGASAVADEANLALLAEQNVIDLAAAREASDLEARKQTIAQKFQEMAHRDHANQIQKQNGGYSIWAHRMGDGPVSYEGAAEYRTGWALAVESQRLSEAAEQAS